MKKYVEKQDVGKFIIGLIFLAASIGLTILSIQAFNITTDACVCGPMKMCGGSTWVVDSFGTMYYDGIPECRISDNIVQLELAVLAAFACGFVIGSAAYSGAQLLKITGWRESIKK